MRSSRCPPRTFGTQPQHPPGRPADRGEEGAASTSARGGVRPVSPELAPVLRSQGFPHCVPFVGADPGEGEPVVHKARSWADAHRAPLPISSSQPPSVAAATSAQPRFPTPRRRRRNNGLRYLKQQWQNGALPTSQLPLQPCCQSGEKRAPLSTSLGARRQETGSFLYHPAAPVPEAVRTDTATNTTSKGKRTVCPSPHAN